MSLMSFTRAAILGAVAFCPALKQASPQKGPADLVDVVRPAVVQVSVISPNPILNQRLPPPLNQYFKDSQSLIVGTGFFVNANGDVVTASHVANGVQIPGRPPEPGVQQIIQMLRANGISGFSVIEVSIPNFENGHMTVESNTQDFPITLVATDAEHDIAVFHPTVNPFTNMSRAYRIPGVPKTRVKFLNLALVRPRDGEQIFACGFPFDQSGLVTTYGAIASAWKNQTLLTAKQGTSIDTYWVDLRLNPGNSGGPVFRMRDHAVLGMAVEGEGSLGFVVPSKYIAEFLKAHDIQWHAATR